MKRILKKAIFPSPKFRIVCRDKNFVPQEFIGIWKVGLYADISKEFSYSGWIPHHFEHKNIAEAELVIERRQKQLRNNNYAGGTYLET